MNIFKNKKGNGWVWIYGLSFLFVLGLLYVIFLYVLEGNVAPVIKATATQNIHDAGTLTTINSGIDRYLTYFKIMPFVLVAVVIVYMFASTIFKQSGQYGG